MKINQLINESQMTCSECGGPAFSDLILAEKKDACYQKVKASAKVWPSAYASGRLVQCRKKGAANYGNKSEGVAEGGAGSGRTNSSAWDTTPGKVGRVEKTATGIRHHADPSRYGGTEPSTEINKLDKTTTSATDKALGVKWDRESKRYYSPIKVDEQGYNPEYDDEAGMADNNLETLARAVEGIDDVISAGDNLPEWCQEKIAVAKSMLVAVWDYMKSEENIEQGVAEVSNDTLTSYLTKLDRDNLKHKMDPTRRSDAKRMKSGPNFVKAFTKLDNRKQGVAEGSLEEDKGMTGYNAFKREWRTKHGADAKVPAYDSKEYTSYVYRQNDKKQGVSEGICSIQEANAIFDDFERSVAARGLTEDIFDSITDEQIIAETAAWRRKEGKSKSGGLNAKGVASYRRENPGSKLQTAVTTKPSKLKPGSKAAKRRKSFCARMSGVKGPMKKPNGKPTRKALALRKWNC